MCQRLTVMFFGVHAILLIGTPVGQARTVVDFTIPGPRVVLDDDQNSEVTFTVFNLLGPEVIRLVDQVQTPGRYVVPWNGRNANGRSVSSGVYLYRLTLLK